MSAERGDRSEGLISQAPANQPSLGTVACGCRRSVMAAGVLSEPATCIAQDSHDPGVCCCDFVAGSVLVSRDFIEGEAESPCDTHNEVHRVQLVEGHRERAAVVISVHVRLVSAPQALTSRRARARG